MTNKNYIEGSFESIKNLLSSNFILLITATDIESDYLHKNFTPLDNYNSIIKMFKGDLTYYIAKLGIYKVVHVQSRIGSLLRDSSIMTVNEARSLFNPKIVVLIGIAFGINKVEQKIGDVLVSEVIMPYNFQKIGAKTKVNRAAQAPASKMLLNRFRSLKQTWEYILPENNLKAKIIDGHILSGEELIDNKKRRDDLLKQFPTAIGGEMEGAGLYAACDGKAEWIVVKGICDFADGEKSVNKSKRQIVAIESAISACLEVFRSNNAFKELGILPDSENKIYIEVPKQFSEANNILFDMYDITKEIYYVHRQQDHDFLKNISQFGIWYYGPSGCGKSNLVIRNLLLHKKNFIQISLASYVGLDVNEFFKEILYELSTTVQNINSIIEPKDLAETHTSILNLLNKHYREKELFIFVEEIPIDSEKDYQDFTSKMCSLMISKNLYGCLINVKFILSSIKSPINNVPKFQQKIYQQMKFIEMLYWNKEDINRLIEIIITGLQLTFPKNLREELILKSGNSPRFIKKYFRNVIARLEINENGLKGALIETERELTIS